ncbi:MAG: lipopolysaccharide biosynthesis protein [Proteobacteria bacterium]|nr:lipopolysaccharide biosynthesis protein [Pseudomonadota bacterium]
MNRRESSSWARAGWSKVGRLGKDAILGSAGLGLRALIQALYLILLLRWMGVAGYGLFAGTIAAVMLVAPLSGWGVTYVLMRRVAIDRTQSRQVWATAIAQVATTGLALSAVVMILAVMGMRERMGVLSIAMLAVGELILLPIAQAATGLCFALGRGALAALAMCLVPAGRLCVGLLVVCLGVPGKPDWVAWSHLIGSVLGVMGSVGLIAWASGLPVWRTRIPVYGMLKEGTSYAVGTLVGQSYQEVDKVLMLQFLGAALVGPYTAAFRVVSVFALPVSGLITAALPRMFAAHGQHHSGSMTRRVAMAGVAYGLAATLLVIASIPFVPYVFGHAFSGSTRFLWALAPWPALFAFHQAMATNLTASNRQRLRVVVESLGMALVVVLNLILLPRMMGMGSALSLLAGEGFMALGCLACLSNSRSGERARPSNAVS